MLVLTRNVGEAAVIGDAIEVSVLSIGPTSVRVGIEAPRTVPVLRKEVYLERRGGRRVE